MYFAILLSVPNSPVVLRDIHAHMHACRGIPGGATTAQFCDADGVSESAQSVRDWGLRLSQGVLAYHYVCVYVNLHNHLCEGLRHDYHNSNSSLIWLEPPHPHSLPHLGCAQVIESFVRHQENFPALLKRHMNSIEEKIIEWRVWQLKQAPDALYQVCVCVCVCALGNIAVPEWMRAGQTILLLHPDRNANLCSVFIKIKQWTYSFASYGGSQQQE